MEQPDKLSDLGEMQNTQQRISYNFFKLTEKDEEILYPKKEVVRLKISEADPFMGQRPAWRRLHNGIFDTKQLMENLQPY